MSQAPPDPLPPAVPPHPAPAAGLGALWASDIPRGCAAAYFPETNVLVSKDSFALGSRTPLSKFIPITATAAVAGGS